jgi:hypothetical protein
VTDIPISVFSYLLGDTLFPLHTAANIYNVQKIYVTIFKEFSKEYKRLCHIKQYTKYNFGEVNIVQYRLTDCFANMESTLIEPSQD